MCFPRWALSTRDGKVGKAIAFAAAVVKSNSSVFNGRELCTVFSGYSKKVQAPRRTALSRKLSRKLQVLQFVPVDAVHKGWEYDGDGVVDVENAWREDSL